ncbi:MAG: molybdopterin-dependent oxidoreductase [Acidimicrobiales bacterium]|nr:molybdopterin-dependent oxidoreductase [Acidimicrobiales bacterium]MCB9392283.1 molybdopterin-dependent oxidoreductase [Acidimicrobiaceae bacterium]
MTQLLPAREVVTTACTLDCPDTCSLAVTVEIGAGGDRRIVDIDAAPGNPLTDGWICAKVKRHMRRVYAPERVTTPLIRVGAKGEGRFRIATWDEAIGTIADRMREAIGTAGSDSIVAFTYNSSAGAVERASTTEALFAALGAAHVEHTICAHTAGASWDSVLGDLPSADPLDVVHASLVVVWGANPTVSNTHFPPLVQQAVARGARVVVIDPRRTAMADRADLHLAVRPGADTVLAHAIANHWQHTGGIDRAFVDAHAEGADEFLAESARWTLDAAAEVTGLTADDIATLADWWRTSRPAMLRIGWGPERNANGGASCRAILALPVLGGHVGVPGSGVIGSTGHGDVRPRRRWPTIDRPARRTLPLHQVGRWMAPGSDDPVRVLFVQGANPVVMCPDTRAVMAAFSRDDVFTVVHEQVLTDTTRYADVVLPATTAFEIDDVVTSYGSFTVQPVRAVIEPVGESRSNDEVGVALARALGFDWTAPPLDVVADDPGPRVVAVGRQFVDTWPFEGRARLVDPVHGVPRHVPLERSMPLTLISPASPKLINSMFGEFQSPSASVLMHPDDAAARALQAGDRVRVHNAQGSIEVALDVHDATRPGVVVMSKGVWLRHHPEGVGVNALTPDTGDGLVNGACFNDTFVEIERA